MTTVILSGWESGSSASGAEQVNFTSGTFSLSTTTVRTGAYALRSNPTTTAVGRVDMQVLNANGALTTTGPADAYARFYFRYAVKPSANDEPIYSVINTSSAFKAELRINSAGNLVLYNQALSLIGTGAVALAADTWYRVELRTGTGTGANYELIINGASELSGTMDQTTLNHGTFRFGKVTNRNGNTVDFFYDDIRIDDAAFPGPGQISKISPNANGSTMQWSGGTGASDYTQVDEIPPSNTDYVQSTAVSDVALFDFEASSVPGISGTINSVMLHTRCDEASAGTSAMTVRVRSNVTNSDSGSAEAPATGSATLRARILDTDPNTSVAWTTGGIDEIEGGLVEDAGSVVRIRCMWAMVSVDYDPNVHTITRRFGGVNYAEILAM